MNSVVYTDEACSLLGPNCQDAYHDEADKDEPNDQATFALALYVNTVPVLQEFHVASQHIKVHANFRSVNK